MASILFYVGLLVVTLLVKVWWYMKNLDNKLGSIYSPPGPPIIAHLTNINSPTKFIPGCFEFIKKYGKLLRIRPLSFFSMILVTDEELVEKLLTSRKFLEKAMEYKFFFGWLGTGLLTASEEKWTKSRKMITPAFHFQILEQFIDVFNSASEILVRKFDKTKGEPVDVYPDMTAYTLDVICETAMGVKIDAQNSNDGEYGQAIRDISKIIVNRTQNPIKSYKFFYMLSRDYWKERRVLKVIHSYTDRVISTKRKALEQSSVNVVEQSDDGIKKKMAFLDSMLQSGLTDTELRDEVNTILFAGHDTTSTAMSFALHCLSNNRDVQDRIMEELDSILNDDKHRSFTYKDLQEMKYLDMVIKETMRLFPPVTVLFREVLQDEQFASAIIPPGVGVGAFPYAMHRDPKNFPDPEKFGPERFTVENQSKRGPYSYIPFSAGPRNCIGQKFAMLEMKATLAHIVRNFIIEPVPERELKTTFELVLKSVDGVYCRMIPRVNKE